MRKASLPPFEEVKETARSFVATKSENKVTPISKKKSRPFLLKNAPPSPFPPPPPPPPPPPLPPLPLPREDVTQHRVMLEHVRKYAGHIRHNLRHVETVEKRAFRIGKYGHWVSLVGVLWTV